MPVTTLRIAPRKGIGGPGEPIATSTKLLKVMDRFIKGVVQIADVGQAETRGGIPRIGGNDSMKALVGIAVGAALLRVVEALHVVSVAIRQPVSQLEGPCEARSTSRFAGSNQSEISASKAYVKAKWGASSTARSRRVTASSFLDCSKRRTASA